jgi:hypothetical protein
MVYFYDWIELFSKFSREWNIYSFNNFYARLIWLNHRQAMDGRADTAEDKKKSAFVSFSVSLKIGSFSSWLDKNPSSRSNCHWRKYLDNAVKDYVTASIWKTTKWCRMYLDHCLAVGRMEISLKVPKKKLKL